MKSRHKMMMMIWRDYKGELFGRGNQQEGERRE
jgi:hypothetical protein